MRERRYKRITPSRDGHGWWPTRTKRYANEIAENLRNRKYKVSVKKGELRTHGYKYDVVITGRRKRRR